VESAVRPRPEPGSCALSGTSERGRAVDGGPGPVAARTRRVRPIWIVLVLALPILVGTVTRVWLVGDHDANGDRALIALAVRAVSIHPVLLGPYSRFGWHHPGPLYYYLLAVPTWLFGFRVNSLVLGASLINLVSVVGIVAIAIRRGGRFLGLWTALFLGVYLVALGRTTFDVWNPSVTLLPFALALALSWTAASGDLWAMPILVVVGSFCAQTHIGLAPGVVVALAAVVLAIVITWRRGDFQGPRARRSLRWSVASTVVAFVVLWFPPVLEQVTHARGNLAEIVRFFAGNGAQHGFGDAVGHVAFELALLPRAVLVHGQVSDNGSGAPVAATVIISLCVLFIAAGLAWRHRSSSALVLLGIVVAETAVAISSVTRIVGAVEFHQIEWITAVGIMMWIGLGAALLPVARQTMQRHPDLARRAAFVGIVLVVVVAARATVNDVSTGHTARDQDVRTAVQHIRDRVQGRAPVVLELRDSPAWSLMAGVALELEQQDVRVAVVRSDATALLFDGAYLTRQPARGIRFVFAEARRGISTSESVVARVGSWSVVEVVEHGS
jgi:hypothetical protein